MKILIEESVVRQALDALEHYGWHEDNCDIVCTDDEDKHLPCSCGFDAAIASMQSHLDAAEKVEPVSIIEQLWAIIDDIDTYGDMAKSDDKAFRAMVERRQKDRWKTGITTDGYTLKIPNHPAPAVPEKAEPGV